MKSKDINNMEKKDITAKTLTVSEETRDIYILSQIAADSRQVRQMV